MAGRYTLGIDCSTQSVTAVVVDTSSGHVTQERQISYRDDPRTNRYGIDFTTLLVPSRVDGEADQPPLMFLAGLDAVLSDLAGDGAPLNDVAAIAVSAQQHAHVYLSGAADGAFAGLAERGLVRSGNTAGPDLSTRFADAFSYRTAPIWQTADTAAEADEIRAGAGGREAVIAESGSNSPLRFTGAVVRRVGKRYPEAYEATARIHLLSSFLSGVLAGVPDCPIDWGNGSGMSLMDYGRRVWSNRLVAAAADGLPGGPAALQGKLPGLASPVTSAGTIAPYFAGRFGFDRNCVVAVGSGDNPQSKVLSTGDLLSLGTSFVYMVDTGEPRVDAQGYANSMYDGLGRPFIFACRTNGAMVWDRVRSLFGAGGDFARSSAALAAADPRVRTAVWQPYAESYPESPPVPHTAIEAGDGTFEEWYPAIVDSALALTWLYAADFDGRGDAGADVPATKGAGSGANGSVLAVTGGPVADPEILRRIAAVWRRPVTVVGGGGAALGSAVNAFAAAGADEASVDGLRRSLIPAGSFIEPEPELMEAFHGRGGAIESIARRMV